MGGKAFSDHTRRIDKEDIAETLSWLEEKWPDYQLNGGNLYEHLLGSSGKNPTSGDLDLNLRIDVYDQDKVTNDLVKLLGEDFVKSRPGNNQIFTAVPIKGDPENGRVQIDFMFGDYEWQKFSYFSPALIGTHASPRLYQFRNSEGVIQSSLKGLYRTELIKAIVAFNSDWVLEEEGEMVARVGPTFFHDKGVLWRYRYRPFKKDKSGYRVKALKEVTREEFLKEFPSAVVTSRESITDPEELTRFLFNNNCIAEQLATIENISVILNWSYTPSEIKIIKKIYHERLNSLKADIPHGFLKQFGLGD